jgi:hypothetical protein
MSLSPDPDTQPVRAAIDSTVMLVLARFLMPSVVAVVGWFAISALDDLKQTNKSLSVQVIKVGDAQAAVVSAQAGLTAKVDGAVKQLDHLQIQVDRLQQR